MNLNNTFMRYDRKSTIGILFAAAMAVACGVAGLSRSNNLDAMDNASSIGVMTTGITAAPSSSFNIVGADEPAEEAAAAVVSAPAQEAVFLDFLQAPAATQAKFDAVLAGLDPDTRKAVADNVQAALGSAAYTPFVEKLPNGQLKNQKTLFAKNAALAAAATVSLLQSDLSEEQVQAAMKAVREIFTAYSDTLENAAAAQKAKLVVAGAMDDLRDHPSLGGKSMASRAWAAMLAGMDVEWRAAQKNPSSRQVASKKEDKRKGAGRRYASLTVAEATNETRATVAGPILKPERITPIPPVNSASGQTFPISYYDAYITAAVMRKESQILSEYYNEEIGDEGKRRVISSMFCRLATGKHGKTMRDVLSEENQYDVVTQAGGVDKLPPPTQHDLDLVYEVMDNHLTYGYATSYLNPNLTLSWKTYWGSPSLWVSTVGKSLSEVSHQFFKGQLSKSKRYAYEEIVPKDFVVEMNAPRVDVATYLRERAAAAKKKQQQLLEQRRHHQHPHYRHGQRHHYHHYRHHRHGHGHRYAEMQVTPDAVTAKRPLAWHAAAVFNPKLEIG